ncbi:MAG TPA: FHA domain-containing protein, partial [Pseudobdellovibrionaceae bacterium]|nr:FHA domain-containing protein [Pseudobdellovibrionaceae bacterium]
MWILRGLSGPAAGQTFELNGGRNLVGRAPHCQVRIPSPSISKEHAEILVYPNRIVLNDLGSSNGSYVRGVKIQTSEITAGDKIAFHDQIFEIQFEVPQDRVQKKPLPKRKPNPVPPKVAPPQAQPIYQAPPPVAEADPS